MAVSDDREKPRGEVLRLRHRYMIEHVRRAEDPAWTEALERQQTVARLGRMFRGEQIGFADLVDYALGLKHGERDRGLSAADHSTLASETTTRRSSSSTRP